MMSAMGAVDEYAEDDDETVTRPLTRQNLPRYSLKSGGAWSTEHTDTGVQIEVEPEVMTQPLATRRIVPPRVDEWVSMSSPTNEMPIPPARSDTTVTRPMPKLPERMEVHLPPMPHAPRKKLESGMRLTREVVEQQQLPPLPSIPRPSLQSDVPLPSLRPRPRLASVGLRPLQSVEGPRFERAPALPTPPLFPDARPTMESEEIEVAPAFRVPTPVPAVATPIPVPVTHSSAPPPNVVLSSFESSAHTKRTTIPPMQHPVGLPVVPTYPATPSFPAPRVAARPSPIPWLTNTSTNRVLSSPFFLLAFAVSLIAMSILGFTAVASSASESRRAARTRTITADDIAGGSVTDATVFIDGTPRCNALPCTLELADGAHWITIRANGYDTPASRTIRTGKEEPKSVHFGLTRISNIPLPPGTVVAAPVAAPAGTPVQAIPILTAPPAASPVPIPHYDVASAPAAPGAAPLAVSEPVASPVANTGAAPAPAAASAPAPANQLLSSTLNINSIPVSSIVLDGRPLGQTPKLRVQVKPGNHSIMFIRKGKRVVRGARVGIGESVTVSARL